MTAKPWLVRAPSAQQFQTTPLAASAWREIAIYYALVGLLHLLGAGLYLFFAAKYPALIGLGFAAYALGLRHAFDADHIAAVDDTVRLLVQKGQRPLGVGFYFSLGHSSVVFLLALALSLATGLVKTHLPWLQSAGSLIGAAVSGTFLWLIGALNLVILVRMLRLWRSTANAGAGHDHMSLLLSQRGLINRLFGRRFTGAVQSSWQMYPLGFLFGLGFDTASEIALLAMTAGAAAGDLPVLAILCLPLLFAAGMCLMDTTDGLLMVKAYDWAFINPLRKLYYNVATTSLSVAVALLIGSIELLQVAIELFHFDRPWSKAIEALDLGSLGYMIVTAFLGIWMVSLLAWQYSRRQRAHTVHAKQTLHRHADGSHHTHRHFE